VRPFSYWMRTAIANGATLRPVSGLRTMLALRMTPSTGDIHDMVAQIDAVEVPGSVERRYNGGSA
jgi:hypothetical protein